MKIDRQDFLQELKLREQIRKAIKMIRERKHKKHQALLQEESRLRNVIRKLLKEAEVGDKVPHASTGINVLEDLLKKIIPVLEDGYKQLTTDSEQRESFRAHVLNASVNALAPSQADADADAEVEAEIEEEVNVSVGGDEDKFIDIGRPQDKPEEKEEPDEYETFLLPGKDSTGARVAYSAMKQIEQNIIDSYDLLDNVQDQELFRDYLLTNLQLYFDKFEDELQVDLPEPESPEYEKRKAEPEETGLMDEESDPL